MENNKDVWSVLLQIRAALAADPPSEHSLKESAFFKWQKRSEKGIPGSSDVGTHHLERGVSGTVRILDQSGAVRRITHPFFEDVIILSPSGHFAAHLSDHLAEHPQE